jgi:integrase
VFLAAGVRLSEVTKIKSDDLNYQDRTLHVVGKGPGKGKPRDIPVDDDFIGRFDDYFTQMRISHGGYLFFYRHFVQGKGQPRGTMVLGNEDRRRHVGTKPFYKMTKIMRPGPLSPHVLRHTYGCLHTISSELNASGDGTALGLRSLQNGHGPCRPHHHRTVSG